MLIHSYFDSASLTIDFTNFAAIAVTVSVFELVPNLVNNLLSLALLTGVVLYSFDLGSFVCLLLTCLFYFFNETVLAFLTSYSFPYLACPAVLQIPYRSVRRQEKLQILI